VRWVFHALLERKREHAIIRIFLDVFSPSDDLCTADNDEVKAEVVDGKGLVFSVRVQRTRTLAAVQRLSLP
jgi:hypothetical protein